MRGGCGVEGEAAFKEHPDEGDALQPVEGDAVGRGARMRRSIWLLTMLGQLRHELRITPKATGVQVGSGCGGAASGVGPAF